jgi:hypothetical protein
MPIDEEAQHVPMIPYGLNATTATGLTIQLQVYDDGQQADGYMDEMIQSLVDHMQTWEGLLPDSRVQGAKYDTRFWNVYATPPPASPTPPAPPE